MKNEKKLPESLPGCPDFAPFASLRFVELITRMRYNNAIPEFWQVANSISTPDNGIIQATGIE